MKQPTTGRTAGRKGSHRSSTAASVKPVRAVTVVPPPAAARKTASNAGAKKAAGRAKTSQQQYPVLQVGDWIDVLDDVGVWNVAKVLGTPSANSVKVRYDGWSADFDEVVSFDSGRIAPYHTYTWSIKCWVKYLNWPWWPAIVTLRPPGNESGIANLQTVDKLFVNFLDPKNFTFWIKRKDIVSFTNRFEQHCQKSNSRDFEASLTHVLQSSATPELPKFATGTLPKQFATTEASSVVEQRRAMGDAKWFAQFARNRELHNAMSGGKDAAAADKAAGRTKSKAAAGKAKEMTIQSSAKSKPPVAETKSTAAKTKSTTSSDKPSTSVGSKSTTSVAKSSASTAKSSAKSSVAVGTQSVVAKRSKQQPEAEVPPSERGPPRVAAGRVRPKTLVLNESAPVRGVRRDPTQRHAATSVPATRNGSMALAAAVLVSDDDSASDSADDNAFEVSGGPNYPYRVGAVAPDTHRAAVRSTAVSTGRSRDRGAASERSTRATSQSKPMAEPMAAMTTRRTAGKTLEQTTTDVRATSAAMSVKEAAMEVIPGVSVHKRRRADTTAADVVTHRKVPAGAVGARADAARSELAKHELIRKSVATAQAPDRMRWRLTTTGRSGAASLFMPADDLSSDSSSSSETESPLRKRLKRATAAYAESFITEPFPKNKFPVGVSSSAVAQSLGVGDLVKRERVDSTLTGAKRMNAVAARKSEFEDVDANAVAASSRAAAGRKSPVSGKQRKLATAAKSKATKSKATKPKTPKREGATSPIVQFSPNGSARLRMMRVGAPGIQSTELDAEYAARALVCISAPNKFDDPALFESSSSSSSSSTSSLEDAVARPPLPSLPASRMTLSLPPWPPAPLSRTAVFSSSDDFSVASWLERLLPTFPDYRRAKGKGQA